MSVTASSYSITMRLHTAPDHGIVGAVATAISAAGGVVTAIDVVGLDPGAAGPRRHLLGQRRRPLPRAGGGGRRHRRRRGLQGQRPDLPAPHRRQDRGHLQGPAEEPGRPVDGLHARASGGSAWRCYNHPEDVSRLTIKGNSVAVVTDGSAVLGLGNIGPGAALPVMEGKAALFKRFANIDAWPICLASQDTDEIVKAVEMIAPGFGGINLEDIAAPRCFEIERRLRESLDIPVFHDDQHGTAIVVLAALTNALRVVEKELDRASRRRLRRRARPGPRSSRCSSPPGSPTWWSCDRDGRAVRRRRLAVRGAPRAGRGHQPAPGARRPAQDALRRRRRVHRRQRAGRS